MTLQQAQALLTENKIPFAVCEYESEAAYWNCIDLFPYTKYAKDCKVIVLRIASNNGKKHIELQFNAANGTFLFKELLFGTFCFEMFDYAEEMLESDLQNRINKIMSGSVVVIDTNDLTKKRWLSGGYFDLDEKDDDVFGRLGFENAMQKIEAPKGWLAKMLGCKKQYDIYDWNTYRCIIK